MKHTGISTQYQKHVAKTLFSMISSGECKHGEMRDHAEMIVGRHLKGDFSGDLQQEIIANKDIRKDLQNVYQLVIVYTALRNNVIELTETEFDSLDGSKLALISPFISKSEYQNRLKRAVELAKYGTAKNIRDLKKSEN